MVQKKAVHGYAAIWHAMRGGAWGVLAGLVSSLCCIGPSAAILLGLGSSSALFGLHVNQTLALSGGILVLIVGCVLALRRAHTCAIRSRSRWHHVGLMLVSGLLAYGVLGVLMPWIATRQEQATIASVAAAPASPLTVSTATTSAVSTLPTLRQATVLVAKMDCLPCVAHLHSLLARKPFIVRSSVEVGNEQVIIVYNSRFTTISKLLALIPQPYQAVVRDDTPLP